MKSFTSLLSSLILAIMLVAIAIFSIQNIQDVSLQFLTFRSIDIPVGVLLAFCTAVGMILGALLPILFSRRKTRRS
ncbi:MAG: lipopolysaccharide assembly protein LapA domain-containing protein [Cyanobacteria bacterium J06629_2]